MVIAKFDGTTNDPPEKYTIEGYPTIYFTPSGRKNEPIKYTGNRDLKDLEKFMQENAAKSYLKKEAKEEL